MPYLISAISRPGLGGTVGGPPHPRWLPPDLPQVQAGSFCHPKVVRLPSRRRALNRPANRCGTPSSVLPPLRRPCALPHRVPRPAPPFLEVCSWCCASSSRSPRARHQVEPIRRRALPFKAEGGLDPGHARAAGGGRGAGAFHAHIAAHTAPSRRAARAP